MAKMLAQSMTSPVRSLPGPVRRVVESESRTLSSRLWDIDWSSILPLDLGDGMVARMATFDELSDFCAQHIEDIFQEPKTSPFLKDPMTVAKRRYYEEIADITLIGADEPIGLFVGEPADWGTYYVRVMASVPSAQGKRYCNMFAIKVFDILAAHGVERVHTEISPANFASTYVAMRMRFRPTGTVLSDRWGAVTRLTKFLCEERQEVFFDQFCAGVRQ
jgi:RimJ/RimL family protein N-acetyltransferase